jgi:excisionase family DNA binding protein
MLGTAEKSDELIKEGFAEVAEAQDYLRLSRASIYNLMTSGELPFARFGRTRRIPWRALYNFAARSMAG